MKNMNRYLSLVALIISLISCQSEDNPNRYELIPYPNDMEQMSGRFSFDDDTQIFISPECGDEVNEILAQFAEQFGKTAGKDLKIAEKEGKNMMVVKIDTTMSQEAYRLNISKKKIEITAATPNGVRYALQTIKQLLPEANYGETLSADENWSAPCTSINDAPRFGYRGMHLDVARHFFTLDEVKRILNVMAVHKLNTLHWHLTDDQGWRIEIEKYPRLTQIGAYRDSTQIGGWNSPLYDVNIHGGYYTREDIREIVDFAAERHIEIVPEIEMPGHTSAAIAAYPELGSLKTPPTVATYFNPTWGVFNVADERVIQFIQDVFDEIFDLFPSRYIHIGGDEVHPESWEANSDISRFMEEKNLDNYSEVQMLFTNRVASLIHGKGRTMIGWNDIMGKNIHEWADSDNESTHALAPYAVVQFWKGDTALIAEALKQGHRVINSSHRDTYLDYNYTKIPLKKAYDFSPFPKGIDRKYKPLLLGSGCQMWSEWIPRIEDMQRQVFPRIAAYAESGWTIENKKNFTRFSTSLSQILIPRWKQKNIAWHKESTPQAE